MKSGWKLDSIYTDIGQQLMSDYDAIYRQYYSSPILSGVTLVKILVACHLHMVLVYHYEAPCADS